VTGQTFTAYFYPLAYGAGLRLEHSAGALWNGFVKAHAAAVKSSKFVTDVILANCLLSRSYSIATSDSHNITSQISVVNL